MCWLSRNSGSFNLLDSYEAVQVLQGKLCLYLFFCTSGQKVSSTVAKKFTEFCIEWPLHAEVVVFAVFGRPTHTTWTRDGSCLCYRTFWMLPNSADSWALLRRKQNSTNCRPTVRRDHMKFLCGVGIGCIIEMGSYTSKCSCFCICILLLLLRSVILSWVVHVFLARLPEVV
jgi:hypothetical protein